jgi:glycosyltransferase involved in cell wall biosynthesis
MTLNILHVVDSYKTEAGTLGLSVHFLAGLLTESGVSNVLLASDVGDVSPEISSGSQEFRLYNPARASSEIRRCDVVHIHGWGHEAARCVAKEVRRLGVPYVIAPCGALTDGPHRRPSWIERMRRWCSREGLVRSASALIAQNELEAGGLRLRVPPDMVHVAPYGLNGETFAATSPDDDSAVGDSEGRTLLVLAPIEPIYGGVALLRALAELGADADGWQVVLAGPEVDDWHKQLAAAVHRKGGANRVSFSRAATVASQRTWLNRAAVLVAVGLHVHTPISIMQALACGIPVLASDAVVPDGLGDCVMVCGSNRASIRKALWELLRMKDDERMALGGRGREAFRTRFDGAILAEKLMDVFGRVFQGTGVTSAATMA